jgi:hypothetical protein
MRTSARVLLVVLGLLGVNRSSYADAGDDVLDRIVENWRWSHYWFGKTAIDSVAPPGRRISALVFWTKSDTRPIRGLCSSEIFLCVAFAGVYLDPAERQMRTTAGETSQQALDAFINSGLRDSTYSLPVTPLSLADLQFAEMEIVLPTWQEPFSISGTAVPQGSREEADRIKQSFGCWGVHVQARPRGCSGSLVFAHYGSNDPYWFVFRACSTACEFQPESVEMVRRGDRHWEVTGSGFIGGPKSEVERLKHQIKRAVMFRLQL